MNRPVLALLALGSLLPLAAACGEDAEPVANAAQAGGPSAGTGGSAAGTGGSTAGTGGSAAGASGASGGTGGASGGTSAGAAGSGVAGASGSGTSGCLIDPPATYDGTAFATNAAIELALKAQLKALNVPMRDAEIDETKKPTAESLLGLFQAGTPSLEAAAAPGYAARMKLLFPVFAAAAGNTWDPANAPAGVGGIYGDKTSTSVWIFDAKGVDLRQAVDKGAFGGVFYFHAKGLAKGVVTKATIDSLLAAWGGSPSFPGNVTEPAPAVPDELSAVYSKRRDTFAANNPGAYTKIRIALTAAQAKVGSAPCQAELDEHLATFFQQWERSLAATTYFYFHDASKKLLKDGASATDLASGLHGYTEGISFLRGLRDLPADTRTGTDAGIDEILTLVGAPASGDASAYKLVTEGAPEVAKLGQAMTKIAALYAFTVEERESFKTSF